jgi:Bacteriophage Mu, Gp27
MARRRGKIARLPKEIRDQINQKLQNGEKYADICRWLAEQGHGEISEPQMSLWYQGGYADWLREQSELEEARAGKEFAMEFAKQNGGGAVQDASLQLATAQVFGMLRRFGTEGVAPAMEEKPELYVRMLNVLVRLNHGALEMEKLRALLAAKSEAELGRGEGGIRPETLERIKKELKLF